MGQRQFGGVEPIKPSVASKRSRRRTAALPATQSDGPGVPSTSLTEFQQELLQFVGLAVTQHRRHPFYQAQESRVPAFVHLELGARHFTRRRRPWVQAGHFISLGRPAMTPLPGPPRVAFPPLAM